MKLSLFLPCVDKRDMFAVCIFLRRLRGVDQKNLRITKLPLFAVVTYFLLNISGMFSKLLKVKKPNCHGHKQ